MSKEITNKLSVPMTVVNGVKYFKLVSNYPGDYTKNCGLLGNEIDENFFFLRSNDIDTVEFDEEKNLVLKRVDGEKIVVNIAQEYGEYSFTLDTENGTLIVTYPDGDVEKVEGFLVNGKDIHVATNDTLSGVGTIKNPLKINPVVMTGQFAPVETLIVLGLGEELPDGDYIGQRFLTHETVDEFGKMYTMREVDAIAAQLKESGWRVPTIEDWNDLLNTIECPADKNHSTRSGWHGRIAGDELKSRDIWDSGSGNDDYSFSVLPAGLYPNRPDIYDASSLYKTAAFWSQTKSSVGDYYAKVFENTHGDVKETTFNGDARLSLRLVKDGLDAEGNRLPDYYDIYYNVEQTEVILGQSTPIIQMQSEKTGGYKFWTKINMSVMNGLRPEEWADVSGITMSSAYFISEWNGEIWVKRQLGEGESLVIKEYEGHYKEWRLVDGVLMNYDEHVEDLVEQERERAMSAETALQEAIDAESERAYSAETILQAEIDDLRDDLDAEIERATSAETELQEAIDAETERAISAETAIYEYIDEQTTGFSGLCAYTEFFRDQVNDLANNVIGVDGSVDDGFSVDFFKADWVPSTKEEVEEHPYEELIDEIPDPETWTGPDYIIVHFVNTHPGRDDEYLKISSTNHYISDADTIVEAVRDLDSKVYDEIEDLKAQGEILQEELENEIERAQSAETKLAQAISAETERATAREDELFGNDIKTEDYELGINGLELHRNSGEDPILITFNANFGSDNMPTPRP